MSGTRGVHRSPLRVRTSGAAASERWFMLGFGLLVAAVLLALYLPVSNLELMGDDYQLWQLAHVARHQPGQLLADLGGFFRPLTTWTLAADSLVWGRWGGGFHLTNILIHLLTAILLGAASRRLECGRAVSAVVGMIWAASPFTSECAISVAIRHENFVLLSWLVLLSAWPGFEDRWSRGRVATVTACVAAAMLSKETWVVTPIVIVAAERGLRRAEWVRAVMAAVPCLIVVVAYTVVHFLHAPTLRGYYDWSAGPLLKYPHQLAVFMHLERLVPANFALTVTAVFAVVVVLLMAFYVVMRGRGPGWVALALLVAPSLPTLLVPFLPARYLAIPYAGFLLLVALVFEELLAEVPRRARAPLKAGAAGCALLVLVSGAWTVRGELADAGKLSMATSRLLAEAREIVPAVPREGIVTVVRAEEWSPVHRVVGNPQGLAKPVYVRPADPYGLVDSSALLEWVLADDRVVRHARWETTGARGRIDAALVHRAGGFEVLARCGGDVAPAVAALRSSGAPVRSLVVMSIRAPSARL